MHLQCIRPSIEARVPTTFESGLERWNRPVCGVTLAALTDEQGPDNVTVRVDPAWVRATRLNL